jgi:SAM-dependent methyltransferase
MLNDFINIDILPLQDYAREHDYEYMQHDIREGLPFDDMSVQYINASHLIEHLTVAEGAAFLTECHRVLMDNGTLCIGTPDLRLLVETYLHGDMHRFDDIQPAFYTDASEAHKLWLMITSGPPEDIRNGRWEVHLTAYDKDALMTAMRDAGFNPTVRPYNETYDMFPEVSMYIEGTKEQQETLGT